MLVSGRSLADLDRCLTAVGDGTKNYRQAQASELAAEARWVLLGEPGSGKSATLRQAADTAGTSVVTARALVEGTRPPGRVAFVDAFEEYRLGEPARDRLADVASALKGSAYAGWRIACRSISLPPQEIRFLAGELGPFDLWQLEPLDVREIQALLGHLGEPDPLGFVRRFDRIAAGSLLGNPTMLILLRRIVAAGEVAVGTRAGLLHEATRQMAHVLGDDMPEDQSRPVPAAIVRAAETACLVLLLTGRNDLWRLGRPPPGPPGAYVTFDDLLPSGLSTDALRSALDTPMFRGEGGTFTPAHRVVAEYLGGRALARATAPEDGTSAALPVRRALAMLCGDGDRPAPALTGLHAWFVTFLAATRHHRVAMDLLRADPESVLFHGDAAALPTAHRRELLRCVGRADPWFLNANRGSTALAALAGDDLTEELGAVALEPGESHQRRAMVLISLATGRRIVALASRLEGLATDPGAPESLRRLAVDACVHLADDPTPVRRRMLTAVLGEPADATLMLRLHLLAPLVGRGATAHEVRSALADYAASADQVMGYARHLGDALVASPMPELFEERAVDVQGPGTRRIELARILDGALAAAIPATADLTAQRLLRWVRNLHGAPFLHVRETTRDAIGAWVGHGENFELALLDEIARTAPPAREIGVTADFHRLTGRHLSAGVRQTFVVRLEVLSAAPASEALTRAAVMACALTWRRQDLGDLPGRVMAVVTARRSDVEAAVPWVFVPDWDEEEEREGCELEREALDAEHRSRLATVRERDRNWFGGNRQLVRSGGHLQSLAYAARIALHEHDHELGLQSDDALSEWFGAEEAADIRAGWEAVTADFPIPPAAQGRLAAGMRTPGATHVAAAHAAENRDARPGDMSVPHAIALLCGGFLVRDPERRDALEGAAMDRILLHADGRDALVEFWAEAMRGRCRELPELPALERRGRQLAPVLDRLLRCRPTARPRVLQRAMEAALRCMPGADLLAVADAVRSRIGRPHARRLWTFAAFMIDPAGIREGFFRDISDPAGQAAFEGLYAVARQCQVAASAEAETERDALVVRHLGPLYPPPRSFGDGPALGRYVGEAVDALSRSPLAESARWLRLLAEEPSLKAWNDPLGHAVAVQERSRIEAAFTAPMPTDVARALACGPPAVPADLRAVVVEVLAALGKDIRDGRTSAWRSFWNRPTGKAASPRIENECRDLLTDRLSDRLLPFRIPVSPPVATEARSENDRRADMLVLGQGTAALPIEVKRHWNPDLWTAPTEQLIPYARSLGTSGHGIYLVLWFGDWEPVPELPPGLDSVGSSETLRDALLKHLSGGEAGTLEVLVIDVSDRETVTSQKRRRSRAVRGRPDEKAAPPLGGRH